MKDIHSESPTDRTFYALSIFTIFSCFFSQSIFIVPLISPPISPYRGRGLQQNRQSWLQFLRTLQRGMWSRGTPGDMSSSFDSSHFSHLRNYNTSHLVHRTWTFLFHTNHSNIPHNFSRKKLYWRRSSTKGGSPCCFLIYHHCKRSPIPVLSQPVPITLHVLQ